MRFVFDRLRVFLFGISIAFLGLICPGKTLQMCHDALDAWNRR